VHFQGGRVFTSSSTDGAGYFLAGEVDLDVVFHVILPSHDLATHVAPPLGSHFGHVTVQLTCNRESLGLYTGMRLVRFPSVQPCHMLPQTVPRFARLLTQGTGLLALHVCLHVVDDPSLVFVGDATDEAAPEAALQPLHGCVHQPVQGYGQRGSGREGNQAPRPN
jgi:hypothetical protein